MEIPIQIHCFNIENPISLNILGELIFFRLSLSFSLPVSYARIENKQTLFEYKLYISSRFVNFQFDVEFETNKKIHSKILYWRREKNRTDNAMKQIL